MALSRLAKEVFGDNTFDGMKTGIGVVATKWIIERPVNLRQVLRKRMAAKEGFSVIVANAVQASCSAYPFFDRKVVTTAMEYISHLFYSVQIPST